MCPSDTYKIYKSRSSVRIDTTLVGFDQSSNWQRGSRSYIFTGTGMSFKYHYIYILKSCIGNRKRGRLYGSGP